MHVYMPSKPSLHVILVRTYPVHWGACHPLAQKIHIRSTWQHNWHLNLNFSSPTCGPFPWVPTLTRYRLVKNLASGCGNGRALTWLLAVGEQSHFRDNQPGKSWWLFTGISTLLCVPIQVGTADYATYYAMLHCSKILPIMLNIYSSIPMLC